MNKEHWLKRLGERLRALRIRSGATNADVARKVGVDPATHLRREAGADFPVSALVDYAAAFNVKVETIIPATERIQHATQGDERKKAQAAEIRRA